MPSHGKDGSSDMQDAIQKVKDISISRKTTDPSQRENPNKLRDKNDPEVLKKLSQYAMNLSMEQDFTNSLNLDYRSMCQRT